MKKFKFETFNESLKNQKIYLDENTSDFFGFAYNNNDISEIINASTLLNYLKKHGILDIETYKILVPYVSMREDLVLLGVGYGWWNITN